MQETYWRVDSRVLGKKRIHIRKRGLKVWNEEIEQAIQEKQSAYHKYIQTRTSDDMDVYKQKRNAMKYII